MLSAQRLRPSCQLPAGTAEISPVSRSSAPDQVPWAASSPPRCARSAPTYVCHLRTGCLPTIGSLLPGRTERRLPGPNMSQQAAPRQTRPARRARRAPSGSPRSMESIALDARELVNGCARYGREVWSGGGRPANSDVCGRSNASSVAGFGTPAKSKVDREDA